MDSTVNDPPRDYIISFSRHMACTTYSGNLNWRPEFRRIIKRFPLSPLDIWWRKKHYSRTQVIPPRLIRRMLAALFQLQPLMLATPLLTVSHVLSCGLLLPHVLCSSPFFLMLRNGGHEKHIDPSSFFCLMVYL